eukprot:Em0001g2141a
MSLEVGPPLSWFRARAEAKVTSSARRRRLRVVLSIRLRKKSYSNWYGRSHVLASCDFTQQGQPCLSLSRSVFFRKCLSEVAASKGSYGCAAAESLPPFAVAIHLPSSATTLDEGRVLLTARLLSRLLRARGHAVMVTCPPSLRRRDDVIPFLASEGEEVRGEIAAEKDDTLLPARGSAASEVASVMSSLSDSISNVVHVVGQRCSQAVQQAVSSTTTNIGGVMSSHDQRTPAAEFFTLPSSLFSPALQPFMDYTFDLCGSTDDQDVATKMADAVMKFEMLSADLNCPVKIELTSSSSTVDSGTRLDGSFVMYNYARMATLLAQYQRNIEGGEYPTPPPLEEVDFSLLSDMEEWDLLWGYVLPYPMVVQEATTFRPTHGNTNVTVPLKKICLFLIRLSHAFSTYYSRVKILLAPEPHLMPLIHARILLMKTVQQVKP